MTINNRWYKPFTHGWFILVLTTLHTISVLLNQKSTMFDLQKICKTKFSWTKVPRLPQLALGILLVAAVNWRNLRVFLMLFWVFQWFPCKISILRKLRWFNCSTPNSHGGSILWGPKALVPPLTNNVGVVGVHCFRKHPHGFCPELGHWLANMVYNGYHMGS